MSKLSKDERELLRQAEDAVLQAQSKLRELSRTTSNQHLREVIGSTAHRIGELFEYLKEFV